MSTYWEWEWQHCRLPLWWERKIMSGKSVLEHNIKIGNSKKPTGPFQMLEWIQVNLQRKLAITLKHSAICLKCLIKNITIITVSHFENKSRDLASTENKNFPSSKASLRNSGNLFSNRGFRQEDDTISILFSVNNQCFIGLSAACMGHAGLKAIQREWLALWLIRWDRFFHFQVSCVHFDPGCW